MSIRNNQNETTFLFKRNFDWRACPTWSRPRPQIEWTQTQPSGTWGTTITQPCCDIKPNDDYNHDDRQFENGQWCLIFNLGCGFRDAGTSFSQNSVAEMDKLNTDTLSPMANYEIWFWTRYPSQKMALHKSCGTGEKSTPVLRNLLMRTSIGFWFPLTLGCWPKAIAARVLTSNPIFRLQTNNLFYPLFFR